ncbi:unnamed protein product [Oppiella nova]|uniref:Uncharacterized protein n=1 Tax=Oppiella nova TaxID=334625 RepID=A0A7R9MGG6_9ACAR|nr:unnamed protein product [Oppiella nova]CAG2176599.1 unnamed protein product [Oppiella nova]
MNVPQSQTEDGFEMHFGVNHLGHFLLTMHLLPLLKRSPKARVVNVSSSGHLVGNIDFDNINLRNGAYSSYKAYPQSKLANVLFTRELARRLGTGSNINTYSLHPGGVYTELQRYSFGSIGHKVMKSLLLSAEQGAQTQIYCAIDENLDNESGHYYADCQRIDSMISTATDDKVAEKLWELSCDLVGLEDHLRIPAVRT